MGTARKVPGAGIDSRAIGEDRVDPESCLRSLTAEALLWAYPQGPLFPESLGVMAVANAFVMLGLLPEPLAEAILAEHRSALERQAVSLSAKRFEMIFGRP
jgi:hypothetical protein